MLRAKKAWHDQLLLADEGLDRAKADHNEAVRAMGQSVSADFRDMSRRALALTVTTQVVKCSVVGTAALDLQC